MNGQDGGVERAAGVSTRSWVNARLLVPEHAVPFDETRRALIGFTLHLALN
jgi:hypothetical protein